MTSLFMTFLPSLSGHRLNHILEWVSTSLDRATVSVRVPEEVVDEEGLEARVGVMVIIFTVSLFAASFPSVSKRVKSLRIPKIVFFIGKHFGTGVILSTAFVHLLQDAFSSLQHPSVKARWNIGKWTGLIVLCSLLSIFFIEYISTSYVDRLQKHDSLPASPEASQQPLPSHENLSHTHKLNAPDIPPPTENTPLIQHPSSQLDERQRERHHAHSHAISRFFDGHHRHESRGRHEDHHDRSPRIAAAPVLYTPTPERAAHAHHPHADRECGAEDEIEAEEDIGEGDEGARSGGAKMGRKRQLVGILVLQMGIMLHSLVIGLTLAITSGSEFTSLVAAITFHQLFEGLSLGIRISSLPASKTKGPRSSSRSKSISPLKITLMLLFAITTPIGIMLGLFLFAQGADTDSGKAQMKFTQGLMCAISAGLLIYAACVEMLAGDFVMDTTLWRSPVWKQAVALASLLTGAVAMAVIG